MPQLITMPHLPDQDIIKLTDLPGVALILSDIIASRVIKEFPEDKYNEELKKAHLSDIEELFRRMPEVEDEAVNIVMNPMDGAWHKWKVKRR